MLASEGREIKPRVDWKLPEVEQYPRDVLGCGRYIPMHVRFAQRVKPLHRRSVGPWFIAHEVEPASVA